MLARLFPFKDVLRSLYLQHRESVRIAAYGCLSIRYCQCSHRNLWPDRSKIAVLRQLPPAATPCTASFRGHAQHLAIEALSLRLMVIVRRRDAKAGVRPGERDRCLVAVYKQLNICLLLDTTLLPKIFVSVIYVRSIDLLLNTTSDPISVFANEVWRGVGTINPEASSVHRIQQAGLIVDKSRRCHFLSWPTILRTLSAAWQSFHCSISAIFLLCSRASTNVGRTFSLNSFMRSG